MARDDPQSRRTVLKLGGGAVLTTVLAGCGGGGGGPGGNGGGENDTSGEENGTGGTGSENETGAGNESNETEAGNESNETAAGNETEEGNESEEANETEGGSGGGDALEPGEIVLGGETQAWLGGAPESIAEEENPTLTLQEGESYEITWENLDGVGHNIQILDDSDEVVDDYETEIIQEEGETQTLEVDEVTSEMTQYICEPHAGTMNGDIEVQ